MSRVISVVGWHKTGKTALVVALVRALKALGLGVGVVKHTAGGFKVDRPGSDTWRFGEAGADGVAIVGPAGLAAWHHTTGEPELQAALDALPAGLDLVLVEGYKALAMPKIVVIGGSGPEITGPGEVLARVALEAGSAEEPHLSGEVLESLVRMLEDRARSGR